MKNLFARYADTIAHMAVNTLAAKQPPSELLLAKEGGLEIYYAPFDYINAKAKIVLVGITPGLQQATNALIEARRQLLAGADHDTAARQAKEAASFSGSMRPNLVALLDHYRVNKWLGLSTCASLFGSDAHLVHYTSVLRYPTFRDGKNYSGSPSIIKIPFLLQQVLDYFVEEISTLQDSLVVPLGDQVAEVVLYLASEGHIDKKNVLAGIPHPSGANNERIAYMLGRKSSANCSAKTNPGKLDIQARRLTERMNGLLAAMEQTEFRE